jgi:hypothetical protein
MKILGCKVIPPLFNVLTRWRFYRECNFADLIQRLKLLLCIELHLRWNVLMGRAKSMTISTKGGKSILSLKDSSSKWKVVSNLKSGMFHRLERTVVVKASLVGRKESMWQSTSSDKSLILSIAAEFSIVKIQKIVKSLAVFLAANC